MYLAGHPPIISSGTADLSSGASATVASMDFNRPPPRRRGFRWQERTKRAVANRRIFPFLLLATGALGLLSGFIVTLVDRQDFPTFGIGIWWAIVTLGTVGYGDVVPHTTWGRVVGSVVIIVGVTFLSFLIATVTSYFVAAEEAEAGAASQAERAAQQAEAMESLRRIEQRLAAIEAKLGN
jgi:voltage-gated potassium channel